MNKHKLIILSTILLSMSLMACGFFTGADEDSDGDAPADGDGNVDGDAPADGDGGVDGDGGSDGDWDWWSDGDASDGDLPPDFDACEGIDCSGHGDCVEVGGVAECNCEAGWEAQGSNCRESRDSGESWTFMIYMTADNDLESFGVGDLEEMLTVTNSDDVNIIVLADRTPGYSSDGVGGLGNWTSTKILKVNRNNLVELKDMGEVDMGLSSTLADFISYTIDNYPADRYAIDFWNHGGGWLGFGWDDSNGGNNLSLARISQGLEDGLEAAGSSHFDLIGFDACLMASLEVLLAVEPYGRYLIAAEEVEPGHGWNYTALQDLVNDPTMNGAELGGALLNGFVNQANAWNTSAGITLSVLDMAETPAFMSAFHTVISEMSVKAGDYKRPLINAHSATPDYGSSPDPSQSFNMVDLSTLIQNVADEKSAFQSKAENLASAVEDMAIYNHAGSAKRGSLGLAVYFPLRQDYYWNVYNGIAEIGFWRDFLNTFYTSAATSSSNPAPTFTNPDKIADIEYGDPPQVTVTGDLDPDSVENLSAVNLSYSVLVNDTQEFMLGVEPASYDPDLHQVFAFYYQDTIGIYPASDEQAVSYAYSQIEFMESGDNLLLWIPFGYYINGYSDAATPEWTSWEIVFNGQSGEVVSEGFFVYNDDHVGELDPQAGSEIVPIVYLIDNEDSGNSGWYILDTSPFDATKSLGLSYYPLPENFSKFVYLDASDISGNTDVVYGHIPASE